MLAFLRDANDSQSVIHIFNRLYLEVSPDVYCSLFPLLLGDNGSEFSNPAALELDGHGNQRSDQKLEDRHRYIKDKITDKHDR